MTYGLQKNGQEQIADLFEQYVKEMHYLRNFSERAIIGYRDVFKRWQKYVEDMPTADNLSDYVIAMRQAGLNVMAVNISIRATNAFLTWLKEKKAITELIRLKKLPEEKHKMRVFPMSG